MMLDSCWLLWARGFPLFFFSFVIICSGICIQKNRWQHCANWMMGDCKKLMFGLLVDGLI